jgi:hypothetical protein
MDTLKCELSGVHSSGGEDKYTRCLSSLVIKTMWIKQLSKTKQKILIYYLLCPLVEMHIDEVFWRATQHILSKLKPNSL